ncbi:MAG: T9SS type A sorting domain-containing protein, partial [Mariniphaga sp.]
NPASDNLTVEFHSNPTGAEIEIYNQYGKQCIKVSQPPLTERMEIDIGYLASGIYLIKVRMGDDIFAFEKIVVRH